MKKKIPLNNTSQEGDEIPDMTSRFGFLCYVHSQFIISWHFYLLMQKVRTVNLFKELWSNTESLL